MNKTRIKWKHKTLGALVLIDHDTTELVLFARADRRELARWSFSVFQSYVSEREDIDIEGHIITAWEFVKLDNGVWDALAKHGIYPAELYLRPS